MTTIADYAQQLGPRLAKQAEGAITNRHLEGCRRLDPPPDILHTIDQHLATCYVCGDPIHDWPHHNPDGHDLHPHCCPC